MSVAARPTTSAITSVDSRATWRRTTAQNAQMYGDIKGSYVIAHRNVLIASMLTVQALDTLR
jgi:hypothetical protein